MDPKNDILIAGGENFLTPYLYRAFEKSVPETVRVWTQTGEDVAPLPPTVSTVVYSDVHDSADTRFTVEVALCRVKEFIQAIESASRPASMVYISTVDVYGVTGGEDINELTPCNPATAYAKAKLAVESYLADWCREGGVALAILRPAMIVGTGMGGELRQMVNSIYRATYRHVLDNTARVSVVHATSLADAVVAAVGHDGKWNVTDGVNPTRHELSEALAWRMSNKRIYNVTLRKARLLARIGDWLPVTWLNTTTLERELTTLTFDGSAFRTITTFDPVSVTYYLRNHSYDESSL